MLSTELKNLTNYINKLMKKIYLVLYELTSSSTNMRHFKLLFLLNHKDHNADDVAATKRVKVEYYLHLNFGSKVETLLFCKVTYIFFLS